MKKILFIISTVFLLSSCGTDNDSKLSTDEMIAQKVDTLRNSGYVKKTSKDTIFLGFVFGMDQSQFKHHFDSLFVTKTLFQYGLKTYAYKMNLTDNLEVDITINPEFEDNKLIRLVLVSDGGTLPLATKLSLYFLYDEKYGTGYAVGDNLIFFNDNTEIEIKVDNIVTDPNLSAREHAVVSYTDLIYYKLQKEGHKRGKEKVLESI